MLVTRKTQSVNVKLKLRPKTAQGIKNPPIRTPSRPQLAPCPSFSPKGKNTNANKQSTTDENYTTPDQTRILKLTKHTTGAKTHHPDINFDDLRPLIDIAYWSSFGEVRRDTASAFCTLSKNVANLEILADSGALGAALALIAGTKSSMDLVILRDSAETIAQLIQLPSMQRKLLAAPTGLSTVFSILRVADIETKPTAIRLVLRLLELPEANLLFVKEGGFFAILQFMQTLTCRRDMKLKRSATTILQRLAIPESNRLFIAEDDGDSIPQFCKLLHDPYLEIDAGFRKALLQCILVLSQTKQATRRFMECSVAPALLFMLTTAASSTPIKANDMHVIQLILTIFEQFSMDNRQTLPLIQHDIIPTLMAIGFSTNDQHQLEEPLALKTLSILTQLCKRTEAHAIVLNLGIVDRISQFKLFLSKEQELRTYSIALLVALGQSIPLPLHPRPSYAIIDHTFHMDLVARGYLYCAFGVLSSTDQEAKVHILYALQHLSESDNMRILLCRPPVIEAILSTSTLKDFEIVTCCAKLLGDLALRRENFSMLLDSRIILFLLKCIAPSSRNENIKYEGARAFASLAAVDSSAARERLVAAGVVTFLMRLAKHYECEIPIIKATAEFARTTIQFLRHDAAALRIQKIMRNWRAKHIAEDVREAAMLTLMSPRRRRFQQVAMRATRLAQEAQDTQETIQSKYLVKKTI
ncbi:hypothetical protein THRCLA_06640 [Thraustotheca clavata]|uniref:Uncharacterized protein n=1 Tax=Thraustotheca clavata TaxID=74557 RepID=A0A1V9ZLQ7_9STRA|nr:hypothetical protein THRCLA_06640 [Thraustotheca clavata]